MLESPKNQKICAIRGEKIDCKSKNLNITILQENIEVQLKTFVTSDRNTSKTFFQNGLNYDFTRLYFTEKFESRIFFF